tara:strand:- start:112 stop:726 length:615 start_codon:yes stop_codon:yes gene_type:complete
MRKNPIIIFEGIEGSGKTTHINFVSKYLKKNKRKFIKIREPGGSNNSEIIRKLILSNKSNFNFKTDLFLYFASRSENYEKIILDNYNKKIILIDRFTDSTIAYQHYGMGLPKKIIILLNNFILNKIKPNYTFINVVNKQNLIKRLKKRTYKNRYDKFKFNFYNKVQKGFIKIAKNKKNYMIIDSNRSVVENKNKILKKINQLVN